MNKNNENNFKSYARSSLLFITFSFSLPLSRHGLCHNVTHTNELHDTVLNCLNDVCRGILSSLHAKLSMFIPSLGCVHPFQPENPKDGNRKWVVEDSMRKIWIWKNKIKMVKGKTAYSLQTRAILFWADEIACALLSKFSALIKTSRQKKK